MDLPFLTLDVFTDHTFGGNHNFNLVLKRGGTLYVDGGKPAPGLVEQTVRNLAEVSPTIYFNVPAGFAMLLPYLEKNAAVRDSFFRRLQLIFYAGAALSQDLWRRLEAVSRHGAAGLRITEFSPERIAFEKPRADGADRPPAWSGRFALRQEGGAVRIRYSVEMARILSIFLASARLSLADAGAQSSARRSRRTSKKRDFRDIVQRIVALPEQPVFGVS